MAEDRSSLSHMAPATRRWFSDTFSRPTRVQELGWHAIGAGAHTLMLAPTGSGKTLAAFLWSLDRLARCPERPAGYRVVYVSPLKALAYDVERNLNQPLLGLRQAATELGLAPPAITVDVRTGDTPLPDRRRQARRPGDILITTPESLYLVLGSRARWTLATAETVIIDEIHALAPTKRGVHLALSLERLVHLVNTAGRPEPQRIGLSATQRPLEVVARYLGGDRPVSLVDTSERPLLDLQVIAPAEDMAAPAPATPAPRASEQTLPPSERAGLWPAIYPRLLELILAHRSTIVFVNSRRLAERLAQQLCELAAEGSVERASELVRAHHGSVSRHEREHIEHELKTGRLRAITATSSLELGIDMGAVDLVIQLSSPGSVARGLQRIGRANHHVGGAPRGRLVPKHRGELLELAAVTAAMAAGEVEPIALPENCLDVLAQQLVAMCAADEWAVEDLAQLVRRAAGYAGLTDAALTSVLEMLSGRYPSDELAALRPRLGWDQRTNRVRARPGAAMLAVLGAGTISDRGLYPVMLGEGGPRIGELDEEMVYESRVGETFLLGASAWRIEQITRDRVIVSPAPGEPGKMPFWRGDRPGRPPALGVAMGALGRRLDDAIAQDRGEQALAELCAEHAFDRAAAENLLAYLAEQRAAAALPTDQVVVVERFRDELGDWRVCLLSPVGARVLAPWALLLQRTLEERLGYPVQPIHTDDGIALRLADGDKLPDDAELFPDPDAAEALLWEELPRAALFAGHFRENAARALLLPRRRPGQRTPLWMQRLRAQQLLGVALRYPSFPIVLETYRECLRDVFDVPALIDLLRKVRARAVRIEGVITRAPSPFARSLAFDYVAAYLYEGDAPVAERRAAALAIDRQLLRELLGEKELRALLDPEAMRQVEADLQGQAADRRARDADEVWDLLRRVGELGHDELTERVAQPALLAGALATLRDDGRAIELEFAGVPRVLAADDLPRYQAALGVAAQGAPAPATEPAARAAALGSLLARYARSRGPFAPAELAERWGVPEAELAAAAEPLLAQGVVEAGAFRPGEHGRELCDAEVLRRIRRATLASARKQVAAASAERYARFLLEWHGLTAGGRNAAAPARRGLLGLREVLLQLEGLPLSFRELEARILPARVVDYSPRMLDELGATGELVWVGRGALGGDDGRVVVCRRQAVATWLEAPPASTEPPSDLARTLLAQLERDGAAFLVALEAGAPEHTTRAAVRAALWELVWAGLVTNDTFAPLRSLGASAGRRASPATSFGGRWAAVRPMIERARAAAGPTATTAAATQRAQALLERWGVVGRQVSAIEDGALGPALQVLSAMEEVGKLRRGFFVDGLGGTQLAAPGALDRLRGLPAADPARDPVVVLSAIDPASPWGAVLPWPPTGGAELSRGGTPTRKVGALVVSIGGACALYLEPRSKRALTFECPAPALERAIAEGLLAAARVLRKRSLALEQIDGQPVTHGPLAAQLERAGARREYRGWVIEARGP